jgi:hypothetical protein
MRSVQGGGREVTLAELEKERDRLSKILNESPYFMGRQYFWHRLQIIQAKIGKIKRTPTKEKIMKTECTLGLISRNGDRTNVEMIITLTPHTKDIESKGCVMLSVGKERYEVLLTDLETACRVMRAIGEGVINEV